MILTFICAQALAIDGDTLRCARQGRVRLAAIDAPELPGHCRRGRQCAPGDPVAATRNLAALVAAGKVRCRRVDASPFRKGFQSADRYGRPVARCTAAGVDLSDAQLAGGFARKWP